MSERIELEGKQFGRLSVVKYVGKGKYECACSCGNRKDISGYNLRIGKTKSCGCLSTDVTKDRSTTHGQSNTKLYFVWKQMINRCENHKDKSFEIYGGRGISVCDEWHDFSLFYQWAIENGYGSGLTIERIDVNGNYTPENCCWITRKDQNRNRRSNVFITYNGETKIFSEWADEYGINRATLRHRIFDYGWSIHRALNTPVKKMNRRQKNDLC